MTTGAAAGTGTPDAGTTKTAEQIAAEKTAADAAAAAAAATAANAGKTPEQLAEEKKAADAAAAQTAADAETKRKADAAAAAAAAASKAPEKYTLTLPEGGRLDASDLKFLEDVARKANWTNDEAQAAITEHDAVIKAQSDRFLAETKADPTYGGDKLEQSQTLARAVLDRIRPVGHPRRESFIQFLNRGGAGNHLEVVSFFSDLGKLMAEDTSVGGRSGGAGQTDHASVLYPSAKT